jgi:integrase
MTEKKEDTDWRNGKRKSGGGVKTVKGKLYARVQYIDEITGKRKEKLRPAKNRTAARDIIKEMRRELEQGGQTSLESDKLTFNQVAEKYEKIKLIPPVFQNGIKITGKRSYKNEISMLKPLKEFFGKKIVRSIKPGDLEAYKSTRLNKPVVIEQTVKTPNPIKARKKIIREKIKVSRQRTISSVNRELSLLRSVFVFAESEDYIFRNPFSRAQKLISSAAEVSRDRVLSRAEELLLLAACDDASREHLKPIVITALDSAMRKGELLKLVWQDIDFDLGIIIVRAMNAKTEKTRIIGMTGRVRNELERLWEISPKNINVSVFGIKSNFNRSWRSAMKAANIAGLHFHDLRHTAITRMVRAGISASEAMKVSGHTEMKTFQRYVNLTNESVTITANLLDNFNLGNQIEINTETASEMVN